MELNTLYDKDFLLKLDKSKNKTIYARITALKFDESPIETIEGRATGGSINIDGSSCLRRTCQFTMVAQDYDYNDYYWGLKTKFKLEIGLQNYVDPSMPDIIWFDQGIFLITSFNTSRSTNNLTISISGKDKMCLLNGEVSGSLESSVDFGQIEEESADGVWTIKKVPIPEIIRNMVHVYAGEPYWNIVINDLDNYGLELLEYRYDTPMYLYRYENSLTFTNVFIENRDTEVYLAIERNGNQYVFSDTPCLLEDVPTANLDLMVDGMTGSVDPLPVKIDGNIVYLAKVEYGQTAGYRITDLIYPGDLIANIGETITSVLDKIRNMLVEFEYFYNIQGQFVFQKKQSFVTTPWQPVGRDEYGNTAVIQSLMTNSPTVYTFSGGELITAFNNNPNLLNMRNDYSIWGERTSTSGAAIPIHMRYAIDKRPIKYTQITVDDFSAQQQIDAYNNKYGTNLKGRTSEEVRTFDNKTYDWREVIYQMALDYYKYNILDDFEIRLIQANPQYPTGQTGYEGYYIDLQGFWRQLYNPELLDLIDKYTSQKRQIEQELKIKSEQIINTENLVVEINNQIDSGDYGIIPTLIGEAIVGVAVVQGIDGLMILYTELIQKQSEWNKLKDEIDLLNAQLENISSKLEEYNKSIIDYYYYEYDDDGNVIGDIPDTDKRKYWHRNVFELPELLNFWFDFLDTPGELEEFNVQSIGSRSKSINDTAVKSIYFRDTPLVIFYNYGDEFKELSGHKYIQVPDINMESMFSISAQGKSAKDRLDELIYQHGYCIESATVTAIPVYYLEPNTRIYLYNEDAGIDGEYIVSKITLPLAYNGTMSITATKAAESLY